MVWRIGRCSCNARSEKNGIGSHQTILLARRTRTMKLCSSDARSEGQSGDSLGRESMVLKSKQKALAGLMARLGESIAKQSEGRAGKNICQGWAGEKVARSRRPSSPSSRGR